MNDVQTKSQQQRIFCAVQLPEAARLRAAVHIASLQAASPAPLKIGWERAEKLHLTLKFLGELNSVEVESLTRAAERAAQGVESFALSLQETGAFPMSGSPRVLWLGLRDETHRLARLHELLEGECEREGLPREARHFHPHLTIARIRVPNAAARSVAKLHRETGFVPVSFSVNELVIMQSQLSSGGSRYTPLSRHLLKTEAGA